ncbi:MAG: hypothetical protein HQM12_13555 [SAR324 cluster bacterium]|nr:hypothetical protein [SAR324 cluster bacterium]
MLKKKLWIIFLSLLISCSDSEIAPDAEIQGSIIGSDPGGTGKIYETFTYTVELQEVIKRCDILDVTVQTKILPCINKAPDELITEDITYSRQTESTENESCNQVDTQEIGKIKKGETIQKTFSIKVYGVVEGIELKALDWTELGECKSQKKDSNVCVPLQEFFTPGGCD